ncbi:MBOAT family O-acyltransferase [Biformimicrobium ophioploci]|uniref:Probable alginate O-acetylase n=1 Tax=Biformimicrobium ophioploci TaxID=3036711 RepID=A0ABQ6LXA5_9GAMM|nr:MBOAT family O-acyltransferase [Microbulbifer sp. NKW57]GMG86732.1 MBOAT family protein [Microbulbifer sp. NKW57]
MLFNSLTFIVFFAVVLILHNLPVSWRTKKVQLLIASYLFYAAWNPPFVLLLWLSTVVDWSVAKRLYQTDNVAGRRLLLAISLGVNLGVLAFFKYGQFLLENFISAAAMLGINYKAPDWNIILPVGISFYTFQTLSYTLDIYLRRSKPSKSLLDFSLFVTFFPQLVAGPIVRPTQLLPQFATPRRTTQKALNWGLLLITLGLFQKIVVADGLLAPVSDKVFGASALLNPVDAWLGTLAFAGQIFADFSGYTTIAIGVACALGFSLPDNFRYPYAAIGFSDFWKRWHISLSSWLRDYLYIPLGGNRKGAARTRINLMLTMLLGGLWHGASWTFVAWGALHGSFLVAERWLRARFGGAPLWQTFSGQLMLGLLTFALVNIAWVFFRAESFEGAGQLLQAMLLFATDGQKILSSVYMLQAACTVSLLVTYHWFMRERRLEDLVAKASPLALGNAWGVALFLIVITQGGSDAFIYFQF